MIDLVRTLFISNTMNVVIVRKTMLAECFGADILRRFGNYEVVQTDNLVSPTNGLLESVRDKNVLIVGGYYRGHLNLFKEVAKTLTVFYNTSDNPDTVDHIVIKANFGEGFATYAVSIVDATNILFDAPRVFGDRKQHVLKIATYLDEYLYGFPSEASLEFQNGVYTLPLSTDTENLSLVLYGAHSIESVLDRGREKRKINKMVAQARLDNCRTFKLWDLDVQVAIGGTPIVDSCILLAEKTGVGMLVRYDQEKQRTLVSCGVTESSGLDAGKIMAKFVNGGGSRGMGGGSVSGLLTLERLFTQ